MFPSGAKIIVTRTQVGLLTAFQFAQGGQREHRGLPQVPPPLRPGGPGGSALRPRPVGRKLCAPRGAEPRRQRATEALHPISEPCAGPSHTGGWGENSSERREPRNKSGWPRRLADNPRRYSAPIFISYGTRERAADASGRTGCTVLAIPQLGAEPRGPAAVPAGGAGARGVGAARGSVPAAVEKKNINAGKVTE